MVRKRHIIALGGACSCQSAQALVAAERFARELDPIPASKKTVKARAEEVRAESKLQVSRNKSVKKRRAGAPRGRRSSAGGPAIAEFRSSVGGKFSAVTEAKRLELRPDGCSKCRGRVGCTRSCWLSLGFVE